jgi:hypothetical protein
MKPAAEMTAPEVSLVEARRKKEEKITVPTAKIDLKKRQLISLKSIGALDSGIDHSGGRRIVRFANHGD